MMGKERDLDAAERAMGTLPRKGEGARARREREAWEMRLAALLRPVEPVAPPPGMFARISESLSHARTRETLDRTRRNARRWKGIASVAGLAVVGLSLALIAPRLAPEEDAPRYVAVVTADDGGAPGMIVQFDTGTGIATVVPVLSDAPDGNVFQMWHVPAGASAPVSLGFLPDDPHRIDVDAGPGDLFGISIEPPGGSPTGLPTDARWHGEIVTVE